MSTCPSLGPSRRAQAAGECMSEPFARRFAFGDLRVRGAASIQARVLTLSGDTGSTSGGGIGRSGRFDANREGAGNVRGGAAYRAAPVTRQTLEGNTEPNTIPLPAPVPLPLPKPTLIPSLSAASAIGISLPSMPSSSAQISEGFSAAAAMPTTAAVVKLVAPVCFVCEQETARVKCAECARGFCASCFPIFHSTQVCGFGRGVGISKYIWNFNSSLQ